MSKYYGITFRGFVVQNAGAPEGITTEILDRIRVMPRRRLAVFSHFPVNIVAKSVAETLGVQSFEIEGLGDLTNQDYETKKIREYFDNGYLGCFSEIVVIGLPVLIRSLMVAYVPQRCKATHLVDVCTFAPGMCIQLTCHPPGVKKAIEFTTDTFFEYVRQPIKLSSRRVA